MKVSEIMTIKQYADHEKVGVPAIRARIRRGTCITKWILETQVVIYDHTIKKPRKKKADEK